MSWHAIDIIQPSIDKTMGFFKGPNLFWRWVKIGLLLFVFSMLSGGGSGNTNNFNSSFPGSEGSSGMEEALAQANQWISSLTPQDVNNIIIMATAVFFAVIVIGILLTILKNMCFFAILESASTKKVEILNYFRKFYGKAVSLTIFEVILGFIGLPFMLILMLAFTTFVLNLIGISLAVLGPFAGIASNTGLMILLALIAVAATILLAIAGFVLGQVAIYWMYLNNKSAFGTWKESLSLVKNNLSQVVLLILTQIVLAIVGGIISLIAIVIIAIPFAIVGIILVIVMGAAVLQSPAMLIPAILLAIIGIFLMMLVVSIALAPIGLFFFNYNLMFLKRILPAGAKGK